MKIITNSIQLLFLLGMNVIFCGVKEDTSLKVPSLNCYHLFLNYLPNDLLWMREFFNDRTLNACSLLDKNHSILLQKFVLERKMYNKAKASLINSLFCSELAEKIVINVHDVEKIGNYSGKPKESNPSSFKLNGDEIRVYFLPVLSEGSQLPALYIIVFLKQEITNNDMEQIKGIIDIKYKEFARNIIFLVYPLHTAKTPEEDQRIVESIFTSISPTMGNRVIGIKIGYDVSTKKIAIAKPELIKLPEEFLQKCASLTVLNLSGTRLDQFPDLSKFSNLFEVDFSYTDLTGDVLYECFPCLHNVKVNLQNTKTKLPLDKEVPENLEIVLSKTESLSQQTGSKVKRSLIFE